MGWVMVHLSLKKTAAIETWKMLCARCHPIPEICRHVLSGMIPFTGFLGIQNAHIDLGQWKHREATGTMIWGASLFFTEAILSMVWSRLRYQHDLISNMKYPVPHEFNKWL